MSQIKTEIVETRTVTEYYCDYCGRQYSFNYTSRNCHICGKDVCRNCSILTDDMITDRVDSDYPYRICNKCWKDGEEIRKQLEEAKDNSESDEDLLIVKWREMNKHDRD